LKTKILQTQKPMMMMMMMMIRNERRTYKNMATENGVHNTTCTMHNEIHQTTYTELQNCLISSLLCIV